MRQRIMDWLGELTPSLVFRSVVVGAVLMLSVVPMLGTLVFGYLYLGLYNLAEWLMGGRSNG